VRVIAVRLKTFGRWGIVVIDASAVMAAFSFPAIEVEIVWSLLGRCPDTVKEQTPRCSIAFENVMRLGLAFAQEGSRVVHEPLRNSSTSLAQHGGPQLR
jgi:hypothetical protein